MGDQNSDRAATRAAPTSGAIASMPSGEQNSAPAPIIAELTRLSDAANGAPGSSK